MTADNGILGGCSNKTAARVLRERARLIHRMEIRAAMGRVRVRADGASRRHLRAHLSKMLDHPRMICTANRCVCFCGLKQGAEALLPQASNARPALDQLEMDPCWEQCAP